MDITINVKSMDKTDIYYDLLITYCLIELEEYSFIEWLLEYKNNYAPIKEYSCFNHNYYINNCELIQ